jgi:hypothetical protein
MSVKISQNITEIKNVGQSMAEIKNIGQEMTETAKIRPTSKTSVKK